MFAKFVEITSCKVCTSYTSLEQYITAEDTVVFFAVINNTSRRMTRHMDSFQLGIAEHLVPFLPGHQVWGNSANQVSSAPYGSAGILPITYGYICMMGAEGLTNATKTAILSANYLAACFKDTYGIVYTGATGFVGHEMILDCRYLQIGRAHV